MMGGSPCNGWEHWYFENAQRDLRPINELRQAFREMAGQAQGNTYEG